MFSGVASLENSYLNHIQNNLAEAKTRFDAWFLVAFAVLILLAAALVIAAGIWCLTTGHGAYAGGLNWTNGFTLQLKCTN